DIKGNPLPLPQGLEGSTLDAGVVEEDLPAIIRCDESKTTITHQLLDISRCHHEVFLFFIPDRGTHAALHAPGSNIAPHPRHSLRLDSSATATDPAHVLCRPPPPLLLRWDLRRVSGGSCRARPTSQALPEGK